MQQRRSSNGVALPTLYRVIVSQRVQLAAAGAGARERKTSITKARARELPCTRNNYGCIYRSLSCKRYNFATWCGIRVARNLLGELPIRDSTRWHSFVRAACCIRFFRRDLWLFYSLLPRLIDCGIYCLLRDDFVTSFRERNCWNSCETR